MSDRRKRRGKIEALWRAFLGDCVAAGFDFQYYKISDPPPHDADPVILHLPKTKHAP